MSNTAESRDAVVSGLLLEAGLGDDAQLRPVLQELRALGSVAPEPSAEVAALLAGQSGWAGRSAEQAGDPAVASPAPVAPVDELAARRRSKRRIALTTLSVAVSLSAGGAVAVASDEDVRKSFTELNQAVTSFITGNEATPTVEQAEPVAPQPPASTGQTPTDPASIPAGPAAATHPTPAPPSNLQVLPEDGRPQPGSPGKATEVPAAEPGPGAVPGQIADGLGEPPRVPVPGPDVPLPGSLPDVPLP